MRGEFFNDWTAVLIAIVAAVGMVLVAFMMSLLLAPRAKSKLKDIPYECGIPPTGEFWSQVHVRYYLFAIMFMIFAVEAVFLFPWAVVFLGLDSAPVFYEMIIFIVVLAFGILYGWRKGVLRWK